MDRNLRQAQDVRRSTPGVSHCSIFCYLPAVSFASRSRETFESWWRQIEEAYHAALECEPPLRAAYIDEKCGGDEILIQEVKSLLARDASDPDALLNQSSLRPAAFRIWLAAPASVLMKSSRF